MDDEYSFLDDSSDDEHIESLERTISNLVDVIQNMSSKIKQLELRNDDLKNMLNVDKCNNALSKILNFF